MSQLRGSQNYIWSVNEVLGQGATGAVYKARHKHTGELYAVKTFNHMSHMRPLEVQMREFEVLQRLDHENIVKLLQIEEETMSHGKVLVMELCTGGSLYHILDMPENGFGLEETEVFSVLHDVSAALEHLRDNGIVHRDIKPGNIMKYISEGGRSIYKLIDFGAARLLEEEEQFMSLYGTEEYLHPDMYERAVLRRPMGKLFGANVDLWSLGVSFYHVATGHLPFRPHGGRKNKETMHKITTEKLSGVISGVQDNPDGEIEWSRDLPDSCQLSHLDCFQRKMMKGTNDEGDNLKADDEFKMGIALKERGAKNLLTPLLAGLLECDPRRVWTFDQYFEDVQKILAKKVIHVFDLCHCESLHVYMDNNERFAKLQELVAAQTEIHANNQLLLYENIQLTDLVEHLQPVSSYPTTSQANPIFLYYNESTNFPEAIPPNIPKFPQFPNSLNLEGDPSFSRTCSSILFLIRRRVEQTIQKQLLIGRAAKMYHLVLGREVEHVRSFIIQFSSLVRESGKRVKSFVNSQGLQAQMLETMIKLSAAANNSPSGVMDELRDIKSQLMPLAASQERSYQEIQRGAEEMEHYIEDYYQKLVQNKDLSNKWQGAQGCQEDDRCIAKAEIIAQAAKQTHQEFKRDRSLKRLSYNEEQIHKFERNKLSVNCTKATSLFHDHCNPNLKRLFKKFIDWHSWASRAREKLNLLESQVSNLSEKQERLSQQLDKSQSHLTKRLQSSIQQLGSSGGALPRLLPPGGAPPASATPNLALTNRDSGSSGEWEADRDRESPGRKKSKSQSKAALKNLYEALREVTNESATVRAGVQTTLQLLESLEHQNMENTNTPRADPTTRCVNNAY